jgi:hypothetical protein
MSADATRRAGALSDEPPLLGATDLAAVHGGADRHGPVAGAGGSLLPPTELFPAANVPSPHAPPVLLNVPPSSGDPASCSIATSLQAQLNAVLEMQRAAAESTAPSPSLWSSDLHQLELRL